MEVCNVTFSPDSVEEMGVGEVVPVNVSLSCSTPASYTITTSISDNTVAAILQNTRHLLAQSTATWDETSANFSIQALAFGRAAVRFHATPLDESPTLDIPDFELSVMREKQIMDTIFVVVLGMSILLFNVGFGCKINTDILIQIAKRPIAPAVGFCCQFLIMAPLSFGIGRLLGMDPISGLGLLAIGSCPGGGGSNIMAFMLGADLELSIIMTAISTLIALGMTPFWIWTLGSYYTKGNPRVEIPVTNVFMSLAAMVLPVSAGALLNHFKPTWGRKLAWCLKPFTGIIGVLFCSIGIATYYTSLIRASWRTILACVLMPLLGYTIGFTVAKCTVRETKKAITISLETGFQNMALAMLMLNVSLPSPESDIAGLIPILYNFLCLCAPFLAFIVMMSYRYIKTGSFVKHEPQPVKTEEEDGDRTPVNVSNTDKPPQIV